MATNELLAEKLVAWWIFAPAKHYADIAYLGGLLYRGGLVDAEKTRVDIRELVDSKLAANLTVSNYHRRRVESLTVDARKDRLVNPAKFLDPEHSFKRLAFFGSDPPSADRMKEAVQRWIVPLLFD